QPEHAAVYKLLVKFAVDCRLERIGLGRPGDPGAGWGIGTSGHLILEDVDSAGAPLGLNTTHDAVIRGGRYLGVVGEECCTDCTVEDTLIVPGGQPQVGLYWYVGSDRLRARGVRIEGGGALNPAGGSYAPLGVWGRECRLEGVEEVYGIAYGEALG